MRRRVLFGVSAVAGLPGFFVSLLLLAGVRESVRADDNSADAFTVTGGSGPILIRIGKSAVVQGTPYSKGEGKSAVTAAQVSTLKLTEPAGNDK